MKRVIVCVIAACLAGPLWALQDYPYASIPSVASDSDLATAYTNFKNRRLKSGGCSNSLRIDNSGAMSSSSDSGSNETYSEGMGYGILLAAYLDADSTNLAKLYAFWLGNKDSWGMMNWKVAGTNCSNTGVNGASDAEMDVAIGLIRAHKRWPAEGWDAKAQALLSGMYTYYVDSVKGIKPGEYWGGYDYAGATGKAYNPSYFATGYMKAFDCFEATNSASYANKGTRWGTVRDKCYALLETTRTSYALPPDWITRTGAFWSDSTNNYKYDACRTPWRIAMDYLWNGDSRARLLLDKWTALFYAQGSNNAVNAANAIGDEYNYLTGAKTGYNSQCEFIGAIACGAMGTTYTAFAEACYTRLKNLDNQRYFPDSLKTLYLLTLTGAFQDPACVACVGCSPTPSKTFSPTGTATPTRTASPTASATRTATPSGTATTTRTATATPSPSRTATASSSASPTRTATPVLSPTWTATTPPAGSSPTATPSRTASALPSATPAATAFVPSPTRTPAPSSAVSPTALVPLNGWVDKVMPYPNPNPRSVGIRCRGGVASASITLYTVGYSKVGQTQAGPLSDGWNHVALPAEWILTTPSGAYYLKAAADAGQPDGPVIGKLLIAR